MCVLCGTFGTSPIENEYELQKILDIAAQYMKSGIDVDHLMEFVNAITDEGKDFEEDPETVGNWEFHNRLKD